MVDDTKNTASSTRYHHGALRAALLDAAESILTRDGLEALTLRAAAREAEVSHAAPRNHFGDLRGLLSDLAARGFQRLALSLEAERARCRDGLGPLEAAGLGYVMFATANPHLFALMFRSERLDFSRPGLRDASTMAFAKLAGVVGVPVTDGRPRPSVFTADQAADIARAWSLVHGFASLAVDGRLATLQDRIEPRPSEVELFIALLRRSRPASD